jgi:protein gp37
MGETTEISWCDATFNPWMGCEKVSPGCAHCYAERDMDHRWGKVKWGKGQERVRTSDANWRKPLAWDRKAKAEGVRRRVFCASLADVFDPAVPKAWRRELLQLIDDTPHLDWLLLTKRPGLVPELLAETSNGAVVDFRHMPNVWLGTTVEDQARADERIPQLLAVRAAVRFLSCEPLLGPVDVSPWLSRRPCWCDEHSPNPYRPCALPTPCGATLGWVITGGESGPGARPSHPAWFRSLRDQCQAADVPFHFKQWGEWAPQREGAPWRLQPGDLVARTAGPLVDRHIDGPWDAVVRRVGKAAAGRLLDGRTWDGVPRG